MAKMYGGASKGMKGGKAGGSFVAGPGTTLSPKGKGLKK